MGEREGEGVGVALSERVEERDVEGVPVGLTEGEAPPDNEGVGVPVPDFVAVSVFVGVDEPVAVAVGVWVGVVVLEAERGGEARNATFATMPRLSTVPSLKKENVIWLPEDVNWLGAGNAPAHNESSGGDTVLGPL